MPVFEAVHIKTKRLVVMLTKGVCLHTETVWIITAFLLSVLLRFFHLAIAKSLSRIIKQAPLLGRFDCQPFVLIRYSNLPTAAIYI